MMRISGAVTRLAAATAVASLLGLLLGSCGSDENVTSPPPSGPPSPVTVEMPPPPRFGSLAPAGQAAEDSVSALLAGIDTPVVMQTALAGVPASGWLATGNCWHGLGLASGVEYGACATDGGWAWEVLAPGDTLLAAGETDATGRQGEFRAPGAPGSTSVAWSWVATVSRDSVAWTYDRDGESVDLHWSRDPEGAHLWLWTSPQARRTGYRLSAGRTTGWCETYTWSTDRWILRQEIAWDGGHGRWLDFDAGGEEIRRVLW